MSNGDITSTDATIVASNGHHGNNGYHDFVVNSPDETGDLSRFSMEFASPDELQVTPVCFKDPASLDQLDSPSMFKRNGTDSGHEHLLLVDETGDGERLRIEQESREVELLLAESKKMKFDDRQYDAPTPTADEVDSALAPIDDIPDGTPIADDVIDADDSDDDWNYVRMEPTTKAAEDESSLNPAAPEFVPMAQPPSPIDGSTDVMPAPVKDVPGSPLDEADGIHPKLNGRVTNGLDEQMSEDEHGVPVLQDDRSPYPQPSSPPLSPDLHSPPPSSPMFDRVDPLESPTVSHEHEQLDLPPSVLHNHQTVHQDQLEDEKHSDVVTPSDNLQPALNPVSPHGLPLEDEQLLKDSAASHPEELISSEDVEVPSSPLGDIGHPPLEAQLSPVNDRSLEIPVREISELHPEAVGSPVTDEPQHTVHDCGVVSGSVPASLETEEFRREYMEEVERSPIDLDDPLLRGSVSPPHEAPHSPDIVGDLREDTPLTPSSIDHQPAPLSPSVDNTGRGSADLDFEDQMDTHGVPDVMSTSMIGDTINDLLGNPIEEDTSAGLEPQQMGSPEPQQVDSQVDHYFEHHLDNTVVENTNIPSDHLRSPVGDQPPVDLDYQPDYPVHDQQQHPADLQLDDGSVQPSADLEHLDSPTRDEPPSVYMQDSDSPQMDQSPASFGHQVGYPIEDHRNKSVTDPCPDESIDTMEHEESLVSFEDQVKGVTEPEEVVDKFEDHLQSLTEPGDYSNDFESKAVEQERLAYQFEQEAVAAFESKVTPEPEHYEALEHQQKEQQNIFSTEIPEDQFKMESQSQLMNEEEQFELQSNVSSYVDRQLKDEGLECSETMIKPLDDIAQEYQADDIDQEEQSATEELHQQLVEEGEGEQKEVQFELQAVEKEESNYTEENLEDDHVMAEISQSGHYLVEETQSQIEREGHDDEGRTSPGVMMANEPLEDVGATGGHDDQLMADISGSEVIGEERHSGSHVEHISVTEGIESVSFGEESHIVIEDREEVTSHDEVPAEPAVDLSSTEPCASPVVSAASPGIPDDDLPLEPLPTTTDMGALHTEPLAAPVTPELLPVSPEPCEVPLNMDTCATIDEPVAGHTPVSATLASEAPPPDDDIISQEREPCASPAVSAASPGVCVPDDDELSLEPLPATTDTAALHTEPLAAPVTPEPLPMSSEPSEVPLNVDTCATLEKPIADLTPVCAASASEAPPAGDDISSQERPSGLDISAGDGDAVKETDLDAMLEAYQNKHIPLDTTPSKLGQLLPEMGLPEVQEKKMEDKPKEKVEDKTKAKAETKKPAAKTSKSPTSKSPAKPGVAKTDKSKASPTKVTDKPKPLASKVADKTKPATATKAAPGSKPSKPATSAKEAPKKSSPVAAKTAAAPKAAAKPLSKSTEAATKPLSKSTEAKKPAAKTTAPKIDAKKTQSAARPGSATSGASRTASSPRPTAGTKLKKDTVNKEISASAKASAASKPASSTAKSASATTRPSRPASTTSPATTSKSPAPKSASPSTKSATALSKPGGGPRPTPRPSSGVSKKPLSTASKPGSAAAKTATTARTSSAKTTTTATKKPAPAGASSTTSTTTRKTTTKTTASKTKAGSTSKPPPIKKPGASPVVAEVTTKKEETVVVSEEAVTVGDDMNGMVNGEKKIAAEETEVEVREKELLE